VNIKNFVKSSLTLLVLIVIFNSFNWIYANKKIKHVIHDKPLWKGKKEVKLTHILNIGTEDFENEEDYFFAIIQDIKFDKKGNLYVLDSKTRKINKFNLNGKFLHSFELKRGKGPGEYVYPKKFVIDVNGDIYISDQSDRRITVLDELGKVKRILKIREGGPSATIALGVDNNIYLTKLLNFNIDRIFNYSHLNGSLIKTFCKSNSVKFLRNTVARLGAFEYVFVDYKGNIFYSNPYPYEIKKFSPDGKLLSWFSRDANFRGPKNSNTIGMGGLDIFSISKGAVSFPDGKILNVIRHKEILRNNKVKYEFWFDIFSNNGEWLISFSNKQLKNKFVRKFNIDPFGYLYLDYQTPYSQIKKFKIEFVDVK
jgi:hypothetical protein